MTPREEAERMARQAFKDATSYTDICTRFADALTPILAENQRMKEARDTSAQALLSLALEVENRTGLTAEVRVMRFCAEKIRALYMDQEIGQQGSGAKSGDTENDLRP